MPSAALQDLRAHVEETRAEIEQAAACVGCLAGGSQKWCRLGLTLCVVTGQPTRPDRRSTS
jgi:hypothetical protein